MSQTLTPLPPIQNSVVVDSNGHAVAFYPQGFTQAPTGAVPISYAVRLLWEKVNPNLVWNAALGYPVSPQPKFGKVAFRALFTDAEYGAAMQACLGSAMILGGFFDAFTQDFVDLSNPALLAWLNELVTLGVLTASRISYVLAGAPPPAS